MTLAIAALAVSYAELVGALEHDPDALRRENAAHLLGLRGHDEAVPRLLGRAQRDDSPWVRGAAARALGRIGNPSVKDALRARLEREGEEQVRLSFAAALLDLGDVAGAEELLRLLRHGSNHIRAHAMELLVARTGELLGMDADAWARRFSGPEGLARAAAASPPRVIDLSWRVAAGTPVRPDRPRPRAEPIAAPDGRRVGVVTLADDTSTHLDAPARLVPGAVTVDDLPAAALRAPAAVLDVREAVARDPGYAVTAADLAHWEAHHGRLPQGGIVIAHTGWGARWGSEPRYRGAHAGGAARTPGFSEEAVDWLLRERSGIAGAGTDTFSIDPGAAGGAPAQRLLHQAGKVALHNLRAVCLLPPRGAVLWIAPLRLHGAGGAPARVLAEVPR